MRKLLALALATSLTGVVSAQTVGVTGSNDYWLTPGGLPNAVSCQPLTFVTPGNLTMNVTGAPGLPYVVFWSFCGCVPCNGLPAMGTSGCLPPASSACPSSNQFLEVLLFSGCVTFSLIGTVNAAGFGSLVLPVPLVSPPITVGTQAIFIGPPACVVAPFNVLLSPGWSVTLV